MDQLCLSLSTTSKLQSPSVRVRPARCRTSVPSPTGNFERQTQRVSFRWTASAVAPHPDPPPLLPPPPAPILRKLAGRGIKVHNVKVAEVFAVVARMLRSFLWEVMRVRLQRTKKEANADTIRLILHWFVAGLIWHVFIHLTLESFLLHLLASPNDNSAVFSFQV